MKRVSTLFTAGLVCLATPAAAETAEDAPFVPFANGWVYGEAGNNCVARYQRDDGSYAMLALTKWNDLSDSLVYWRPGLAPMADPEPPAGSSDEIFEAWEEQASDGWGVGLEVDGVPYHLATMISDRPSIEDPDRTVWRIGLLQQEFLDALETGDTLTVAHNGEAIDTFPVSGSAELATLLRACVAADASF